jgi:hypothetical protein
MSLYVFLKTYGLIGFSHTVLLFGVPVLHKGDYYAALPYIKYTHPLNHTTLLLVNLIIFALRALQYEI